jgi:DNA (cytosine-5)-methyltransferase 1
MPWPDIVVAGTPCQAFSIAGKRQSLADDRGNLTLQFVRLIHGILNAKRADGAGRSLCVVWENVPGVLSTKDNAFGCFLSAIVGGSDPVRPPGGSKWPGFGMVAGPWARAAWGIRDAQYFGLAQRRRRVFVVVSFGNRIDPAEILFERAGLHGDFETGREAGQDVAGTLSARHSAGGGLGTDFELDGRLIAGTVSCKWARGTGGPAGDECYNLVTHALRAEGFDASEDGTGHGTPLVPCYAIQERAVSENPDTGPDGVGVQEGIAYTLEAHSSVQAIAFDTTQISSPDNFSNPQPGDPCHPLSASAHAPSIAFSSKDYGADATHDLAPTLRAGGHTSSHANTGVPPAIVMTVPIDMRQASRGATMTNNRSANSSGGAPGTGIGEDGDPSPMLSTSHPPAVIVALRGREGGASAELGGTVSTALCASQGGGDKPYVLANMAVRRLTPRECERLQGFPNNHTAISWRGDIAPDGPRYRALGNSMAVPVLRWILTRIYAAWQRRQLAEAAE